MRTKLNHLKSAVLEFLGSDSTGDHEAQANNPLGRRSRRIVEHVLTLAVVIISIIVFSEHIICVYLISNFTG
jgi:hypothetical protein